MKCERCQGRRVVCVPLGKYGLTIGPCPDCTAHGKEESVIDHD